MMRKSRVAVITIVLLGAWALSACEHARFYSGVTFGPPPLRVAGPVGPRPSPGWVWVDGYYDWGGSNWVWFPGRWAQPPRRGSVWRPPTYQRFHNGYRVHPGHWAHR